MSSHDVTPSGAVATSGSSRSARIAAQLDRIVVDTAGTLGEVALTHKSRLRMVLQYGIPRTGPANTAAKPCAREEPVRTPPSPCGRERPSPRPGWGCSPRTPAIQPGSTRRRSASGHELTDQRRPARPRRGRRPAAPCPASRDPRAHADRARRCPAARRRPPAARPRRERDAALPPERRRRTRRSPAVLVDEDDYARATPDPLAADAPAVLAHLNDAHPDGLLRACALWPSGRFRARDRSGLRRPHRHRRHDRPRRHGPPVVPQPATTLAQLPISLALALTPPRGRSAAPTARARPGPERRAALAADFVVAILAHPLTATVTMRLTCPY